METNGHDVTQLLIDWREGDDDAPARLKPLVAGEVRRLIQELFQPERSVALPPGTALAHEAYLRMVDDSRSTWADRARFYGIAARAVREVLVERARTHAAAQIDLVALDGALENFSKTYPRKSEVVELKFFGGLETKVISETLHVPEKAIFRDWNFAKLWLCRALSDAP
jgi:hypothetical protein